MDVGFDTIGSATLIFYDRRPVLVTDPWLTGSAFFGSWRLSHEVPEEQTEAIDRSEFVWFSHGHPDHLNWDSLGRVRNKKVLLPDHVGGRIHADLLGMGFDVRILEDRVWYPISERIRVACVADYNQDAVLLADVNGRLVVNVNDANDCGWGRFVRRTTKHFRKSFLLALEGFGAGDMINFFREDGTPVPQWAALRKPIGPRIAERTEHFGTSAFIPFSSMHRYQRADSVWADPYTVRPEDYAIGFESKKCDLLPAFVRYDCATDEYEEIRPPEIPAIVRDPSEFGDDWSEPLGEDEAREARAYFRSFEKLPGIADFVVLRVGGRDSVVELKGKGFRRGIAFEVPRHSLTTAIGNRIFDDLLIGNFMKTTFLGAWSKLDLYPWFTPYVAKYGDNGGARSAAELDEYFKKYRDRAPADALHHFVFGHLHRVLEEKARDTIRRVVSRDSTAYRIVKKVYRTFPGAIVR